MKELTLVIWESGAVLLRKQRLLTVVLIMRYNFFWQF